jgi:hypothetical protein
MSDDEKEGKKPDDPKLPIIQNRVIRTAVEIEQEDPLEIVYQHSLFCQVALPRRRPEGRIFERSYRDGLVRMETGVLFDGFRMVEQPLPAGPKPRLALCHLNSEAVKTRCPVVEVDRSARKFMERLGLNTDGGSSYSLFKREMKALAACRMTLGFGGKEHPTTVDSKPIRRFEAWLGRDGSQLALWPGIIELSQEYFESLLEHAVPLDPRAMSALAHSAMALDAYSFLARRLFTLEKSVKVTWHQFHKQFGHEYRDWRNFKKEFLEAIRAALAVYPSAKVEEVTGGLLLKPSLPPVHREAVAVSHGLAEQVRARLPQPQPVKDLTPTTIEQFRKLYPRIDPYVCKGDFDAWLETKQQPRSYDKAFLGFAKKWVKGKF